MQGLIGIPLPNGNSYSIPEFFDLQHVCLLVGVLLLLSEKARQWTHLEGPGMVQMAMVELVTILFCHGS